MKRLLLFFLFSTTLTATEYNPWFSPLWEFQGRLSYIYDHIQTVQSPKGNFSTPNTIHSIRGSLGITPWPYWNVELELFLTRANDIPFSYEAACVTVRYQWLDDIRGDPIALATGITLSFPRKRYLRNFSFIYHGELNAELHTTIGKEWSCNETWWTRGWILGGWGIANRGNGWLHGLAVWEFNPKCFEWGVFTEALYGLGPQNIATGEPFKGYASIDHRTIDIGGFLNYRISCLGTLTCLGWYNAYAHNCVFHNWGLAASLLIPFSL